MEKDIIKLKFDEYLNKYSNKYSSEEANYIKENFFDLAQIPDPPDILMQLYSDLGLFNNSIDRYQKYALIIENIFGINKEILEVGGGYVPALANILARKQLKLGYGSVTVLEPLLIVNEPKYKNLKLIKEKMSYDTIIKPFDLIVGIMPCEATSLILEQACKNNKEFFIALCGCSHFSFYETMAYGTSNYQNYIIDYASKLLKEYDNGKLYSLKLPKRYNLDYPIIYNKKS